MRDAPDAPDAHEPGPPRLIVHSRHDQDGVCLAVSDEVRGLLGHEPEELVGTSAYDWFHPEDLALVASSHARALGMPDTTTVTYRIRRRDGSYRYVTTTSLFHLNPDTGVFEIDAVTTPSLLEAGSEPERSLDQEFAYRVERATSMVAVLDVDAARIHYANPLLERAVGVEPGELEGASFFELVHPTALARVVGALSGLLHRPFGTTTVRCLLRHVGGGTLPVIAILHDLTHDPAVGGLLVVAHEATLAEPPPSVRREGGPAQPLDRAALQQRLVELLATSTHGPSGLALVSVGLEEIDDVTAALGPAAAAEVLHQACTRLRDLLDAIGAEGEVGRLSAGTVAVLVRGTGDLADARELGERVRDALSAAFHVERRELFVAPRVAVALAGSGVTAEGLLAAGHQLLEQAAPGTRVMALEATRHELANARLRLRTDLRHSIERDQLELHYQPSFSLNGSPVCGAEALVRWRHPTRGLLAPGEFLAMAEESDFIYPLGAWVLETACRQLMRWSTTAVAAPTYVSVNVSTHQLLDTRFTDSVVAALEATSLDPSRLYLEITETAVLSTGGYVESALRSLQDLGLRFAIDDFGTGHASLSYLKRIPAEVVKIDRSFVSGLDQDDPDDLAIVAGTIAMAHALGRTVTAEGVETEGQLRALRNLGCDHVQGYLLSRPVPAQQLPAVLLEAERLRHRRQ